MPTPKEKAFKDKLSLGAKKEIVKNQAPDIEKAVDQIHVKEKEVKISVKKVRSTVDLSEAEHKRMKIALVTLDKSSQDFIKEAILEKLDEISSSVTQ